MKLIFTAVFLLLLLSAQSQETPPVHLVQCAAFTAANNTVARFNGSEKGSIEISLHANGTFEYRVNGGPMGRASSSFGSYRIAGDQITFNYDNGSVQQFRIFKMDMVITKLVAGEKVSYFVREVGN